MKKNVLFSQKSMMMWKRAKNSPIMKKMLGNANVAGALDKTSERDAVYRDMQAKGAGGVTKEEMKEIFGKYVSGQSRHISRKEGYIIAKEIFPDDPRRYKYTPKSSNQGTANSNTSASRANNFGFLSKYGAGGGVKSSSGAFRRGADNRITFVSGNEIGRPVVSASYEKIKNRQTVNSIKSSPKTSYFSSIRRVMRGS